MSAALYFKDSDGVIKPVPLVDGSSVNVEAFVSVDRASVHPAGTAFDVPRYAIGSGELSVFYNGLLCVAGRDYTEASETTVTFSFDLPVDAEITAVSTTSPDGSMSLTTQTSESRDGVLKAGTPYAVPAHAVGSDFLKVFLNGLMCQEGVHFTELSSSAISFTSDIPADAQISVTATVAA